MLTRSTFVAVLFGLALVGGAAAPPARSDPLAPPPVEAKKPDPSVKQVTLVGVVEFDEHKLAHIPARLKGRIDKLHVTLVGQQVKRGDPLAEMYSPDLLVTAQNLLDANRSGNQELEKTTRERLQLWGIGDDQVKQIVKTGKAVGTVTVRSPIDGHVVKKCQAEGDTIEEGTRLFDVADLSTLWVEAPVPDQSDLAVIKPGLPVRVTAPALPDRRFDGQVLVAAYRDPDSKALRVRFAVNNPREELRPGMHVTVVLAAATNADTAELAKTKVATAKAGYEGTVAVRRTGGRADPEQVYLWSRRWMEAERDVSDKPADRVAAIENHKTRMKELHKFTLVEYQAGKVTHAQVLGADFYAAEAELWLAEAKAM